MCVQAPGAFNLSLLCALIHGGGGALWVFLSVVHWPLENVEPVVFGHKVSLTLSCLWVEGFPVSREKKEKGIRKAHLILLTNRHEQHWSAFSLFKGKKGFNEADLMLQNMFDSLSLECHHRATFLHWRNLQVNGWHVVKEETKRLTF